MCRQLAQSEHRALAAERVNDALRNNIEELHARFAAIDLSERHLEEEVVSAATAVRDIKNGKAALEPRSAGSEAAAENLRRVRNQFQDVTAELAQSRERAEKDVATLEFAHTEGRRRHAETESMLREHLSEHRASSSELRRLQQALAARSAEFGPLEADAHAAKAAEQEAIAQENEISLVELHLHQESLIAASHHEIREELRSSRQDLDVSRANITQRARAEQELHTELSASGHSHNVEERHVQMATQQLVCFEALHEQEISSHDSHFRRSKATMEVSSSELNEERDRVHGEVARLTQDQQ